jgi:hypothetical protein
MNSTRPRAARLRPRCGPVALAAGLVLAVSALAPAARAADAVAPAPATGPHPVRELHYGDVLFQFYQDHYFTALTNLMVSQQFNRMPREADEAEILRGGLLLSYGLHNEAAQIFEHLADRGATPAVRDRAWYYLAKIRYQRGLPQEAQAALDRVGTALPPDLQDDRLLLAANVKLALGDAAGAAKVLGTMAPESPSARYARFNLGVALIREGQLAQGTAALDVLGKAPAYSEEDQSLRDKANLALGFAALKADHAAEARGYLERVRLTSPFADKALLGFGWAASALGDPKKALVPWNELQRRDASDAAVLEARIAVPYALAELGAEGQALQRYQEAIGGFEKESTALDESIGAIRSGKLVQGLLEHNPGEEMGWFWTLKQLPQAMPHASQLDDVIAQHDFQEALKNYRDLLFLQRNLQDWRDRLGVFGDMLATRRQGYAEHLPAVQVRQRAIDLDALQQRRDALASELQKAEADTDWTAFADAKQRALLERAARVQAALDHAGNEASLAETRERARMAIGALTWDLAQAFPDRLWQAKKSLKELDAAIAQAHTRSDALAQAQHDEPARLDAFAARIPVLAQRIDALLPRVVALASEQQGVVQEIAVAALERQKQRLASYTAQARFAIAQLYDRAHIHGEATDAQR